MELEEAKNEVRRKIGRNIVLFQEMEAMLKLLITNSKFSGCISELKENREQRAETAKIKTMGALVGQYLEDTHLECDESNRKSKKA